jgi:GntR family transcriptional regulator/MocR family aminotransferase
MRFVGRSSPPVASQGLDNVIYISGFSKYLGAVCRIAFIVAHEEAISALRDIRRYQLRNLSGHEQRTLAHFIKNGGYDQQIRTMRKVAKQRWQACQRLIAELLPEWTVTKSTGGLNLWVELPEPIDTKALAKSLREYSVVIEPGLVFFADNKQGGRFIKLGFVLLSEEQLRDGLLIIRGLIKHDL